MPVKCQGPGIEESMFLLSLVSDALRVSSKYMKQFMHNLREDDVVLGDYT